MVWVGINMLQFTGNASPVGAFDALPTAKAVGNASKASASWRSSLKRLCHKRNPHEALLSPKSSPLHAEAY